MPFTLAKRGVKLTFFNYPDKDCHVLKKIFINTAGIQNKYYFLLN